MIISQVCLNFLILPSFLITILNKKNALYEVQPDVVFVPENKITFDSTTEHNAVWLYVCEQIEVCQ